MAIIKCKMCGGDLEIMEGSSVAECEYCGSKQTVPSADNEKKLTLFARANRLRTACEFDKAAGVYESIVADFPEEAEAYWGLVLCRYGIEYVDDPATGKKIPTCHRSSFESIMEDADFEQACENADAIARRVYRDEAKQLEEIRKGIIEVSGKEAPYDIFICYKETDENGDRTVDSVIAQDVYDALTDKGYRVFFSRISLEDKLGVEYEPYIFAALNSAKIMLAFGTDFEYYNAVWVKNEWSRFLKLMAADKSKYLIPCFKGIDAYDMPKEFAKLQAQDMGKVGAMQDLLRGIEKILPKAKPETVTVQQTVVQNVSNGPSTDSLLQRGHMALEDKQWTKAAGFFEQTLNLDPQCAEAYLGQAMTSAKKKNLAELGQAIADGLLTGKSYARAKQFASPELLAELESYEEQNRVRLQKLADAKAAAEKAVADRESAAVNITAARRIAQLRPGYAAAACHISLNCDLIAGLKENGTVVTGSWNNQFRAYDTTGFWRNIVAVATGIKHMAGLKKDGTVVATGDIAFGQCNVKGWRDIVAIAAAGNHTVGLKADGTVVATGDNRCEQCHVDDWRDIVAIAAGQYHTVGLRADGTVVATGDNAFGRCNVKNWRNVIAIAAGIHHTVGLKADGTVLAVGDNKHGQCDISGWQNIVAIAAGYEHTVGLKADGTVVAEGSYEDNKKDVWGWHDIAAIAAGIRYTVGIKKDGTVITTKPYREEPWLDKVNKWCLFRSFDQLPKASELAFPVAEEPPRPARKPNSEKVIPPLRPAALIAAGYEHTVGLKADGTVVTTEDNSKVSDWQDIVAVAAGYEHTVGLKADGTVVAADDNGDPEYYAGQCDVEYWQDIVAVAAGSDHTVGLMADGTVVATGSNKEGQCNVSSWQNITAISAGVSHTVGLRADGTVVATTYIGKPDEYAGQCEVSGWRDIVAISAGRDYTVGLKKDGTVIATAYTGDPGEYAGQCDISDWRDITAISAGVYHTVGLRADGTVIATTHTGDPDYNCGQCEVSGWRDIVAIAAGSNHTVGLKKDGTVIATAYTGDPDEYCGQCDVADWKLFKSIDSLKEERDSAMKAAEERRIAEEKVRQAQIAKLDAEKSALNTELANLKGLFTGKRRNEIEARLAEIDAELQKLN